jgi:hypothetical protein
VPSGFFTLPVKTPSRGHRLFPHLPGPGLASPHPLPLRARKSFERARDSPATMTAAGVAERRGVPGARVRSLLAPVAVLCVRLCACALRTSGFASQARWPWASRASPVPRTAPWRWRRPRSSPSARITSSRRVLHRNAALPETFGQI